MNNQEHIADLEEIADQLLTWVDETKSGGYSTHQVEPMKKLATDLLVKAIRLKRDTKCFTR